jgi:hypothetical protein
MIPDGRLEITVAVVLLGLGLVVGLLLAWVRE